MPATYSIMYKNLLAIFAGLVAAFLVLMVIENTIPPFFQVAPPAPNLPKADFEAYINSLPKNLLITNAISYGIACLIGSIVTMQMATLKKMAYGTVGVFLIVVLVNFFTIHHPQWMIGLGVASTIIGGIIPILLKRQTT